jgi:surfactin synthase thioesterase subunit
MSPEAPLTLWCLPNAGAGAAAYARWRRMAPPGVTVQALELPGRGTRMREPLMVSFDALCDELEHGLRQWLTRGGAYALFGHSMGALLAYELAQRLRTHRCPPRALLVSGSPAPRLRDPDRFAGPLDDQTLTRHLRQLGGTPAELLDNAEMMQLTLPVLRADFRVCASYRHRPRAPLSCPVHAFGGRADHAVGDTVAGWKDEAGDAFTLDWYDGGHFFLHDHAQPMLARIGALLAGPPEPVAPEAAANPRATEVSPCPL